MILAKEITKTYSVENHISEEAKMHDVMLSYSSPKEIRGLLKKATNPYPRYIYRYYGPDQSIDRLEEYLIDGDFWLSSPEDFNDPFDMAAHVESESTLDERRAKIVRLVRERGSGLSRREREQKIADLMSEHTNNKNKMKDILDDNTRKCGVICFSEDPRNLLMWSHYCHHHRGFVIQFEISRDAQNLVGAIPVSYGLPFPRFNWYTGEPEQMRGVLLNKFEGWKYEKERRIIRNLDAHKHIHFKPEAITSIIIGCRSDTDLRDKIWQVLAKRDNLGLQKMQFYKAVKHDSDYKLRILRLTPNK